MDQALIGRVNAALEHVRQRDEISVSIALDYDIGQHGYNLEVAKRIEDQIVNHDGDDYTGQAWWKVPVTADLPISRDVYVQADDEDDAREKVQLMDLAGDWNGVRVDDTRELEGLDIADTFEIEEVDGPPQPQPQPEPIDLVSAFQEAPNAHELFIELARALYAGQTLTLAQALHQLLTNQAEPEAEPQPVTAPEPEAVVTTEDVTFKYSDGRYYGPTKVQCVNRIPISVPANAAYRVGYDGPFSDGSL